LLLLEARHLPVYYFPPQDVRTELLEPTGTSTHCPRKGDASYWSVRVGDRVARDAVWSYQDPLPERADIKGYLALYWDRMDAWFEEDDEVFVHPPDPDQRVGVLGSSAHDRAPPPPPAPAAGCTPGPGGPTSPRPPPAAHPRGRPCPAPPGPPAPGPPARPW